MADFWKGFGKGFGPAYEGSFDRARSRREKREDREYAKKQRQDEIDRLAQIAKDKSVAETLAYGDAGVDLGSISAVEKQRIGPFSPEYTEDFDPKTGLPRRSVRDTLEVLDRPELGGAAVAAKLKHDKLLLQEKRGHEKSLLDAKQRKDDFKADYEATVAQLEALASSGATKIPLGRLASFRENEKKRLATVFQTAATKYKTASVDERDDDWKTNTRVLAPLAAFQTWLDMPPLPAGSRISEDEARELWDAHRLGEGAIVGAKALAVRERAKKFEFEDLREAKNEVEGSLEELVREYVGLVGIDWNENAQSKHDELMNRIRVPNDAWKVHGGMVQDVNNLRLLDSVKDSDFFAEKARNLVKEVMADPSLRTNTEAVDFLMKNISPEKPAAWRKQFEEWKALKGERDAEKDPKRRADIQEKMNFIHRKANPFEPSARIGQIFQMLEEIRATVEDGDSGGDGSQPPPVVEEELIIPPLPGDIGIPKEEAVPPDAKPLPPEAKVTAEGVTIGNITYPIGKPLGNEGGQKYEIIIINGKPYQRPVK